MKRLLSMLCAAALLILMLSPGAQAVSITNAESWDLYCLYTVPGSAVVYDLTIQEIADGDEPVAGADLTYVFTPIDTLSGPARVTPTGEAADG